MKTTRRERKKGGEAGDGEEKVQKEEKQGRTKGSKETDKTEISPTLLALHTTHTQINVERNHSETRHEGNIFFFE